MQSMKLNTEFLWIKADAFKCLGKWGDNMCSLPAVNTVHKQKTEVYLSVWWHSWVTFSFMVHYKLRDLFLKNCYSHPVFEKRIISTWVLYFALFFLTHTLWFPLNYFSEENKNRVRWLWILILIFNTLANQQLFFINWIFNMHSVYFTSQTINWSTVRNQTQDRTLEGCCSIPILQRELQAIKHNCFIYITFP